MTHSVTRPVAHGVNLYYEGYHRRFDRLGSQMTVGYSEEAVEVEMDSGASSPKEFPETVDETPKELNNED